MANESGSSCGPPITSSVKELPPPGASPWWSPSVPAPDDFAAAIIADSGCPFVEIAPSIVVGRDCMLTVGAGQAYLEGAGDAAVLAAAPADASRWTLDHFRQSESDADERAAVHLPAGFVASALELPATAAVGLLDMVPWGHLKHAYGDAADVPNDLRAIHSPAANDFEAGLSSLYGSVCHQGTRYGATPYVIPFVFGAIARFPERRADLLTFLLHLQVGYASDSFPHISACARRLATNQ